MNFYFFTKDIAHGIICPIGQPGRKSRAVSDKIYISGGNAATELTVWLPVYQFGDGISDEDFWNEKFDAFEAENNCTIKVEIQGSRP